MRGFSRDSDDGLFPSRILPKEEIKKAKEILGARSLNLVDLYGSYLRKLELIEKIGATRMEESLKASFVLETR